jgi:hypothetical protein
MIGSESFWKNQELKTELRYFVTVVDIVLHHCYSIDTATQEPQMNAKQRANELYQQHIGLATSDPRLFRKTVMDTLMAETGCSLAAAATHYNNAKKVSPVEGLGRAPAAPGTRKNASKGGKNEITPDNECFSVLEVLKDGTVGRCVCYEFQGEAGEAFEDKPAAWPNSTWVMIQGIGPNSGEAYKLDDGEKELRRYDPVRVPEAA